MDIEVTYKDLLQLDKLIENEEEVIYKTYKVGPTFGQHVTKYKVETYKGIINFSLMASSLENSCKDTEEDTINNDFYNTIQQFIKKGQGRKDFCVFLSAVTTKNGGENTIEYYACKKLAKFFKKQKIGVFWWEDNKLRMKNWNISGKIATGLACASILVCLAFDSVEQRSNEVDFICFDEQKGSQCLKYEVEKFRDFSNQQKRKEFVKGFYKDSVDGEKFENLFPNWAAQSRVFSYGKPITEQQSNEIFNNSDIVRTVEIDSSVSSAEKIKSIVKAVVKEVVEILDNDENKEIAALCRKRKINSKNCEDKIKPLLKEIEEEWTNNTIAAAAGEFDYLYKPFAPNSFAEGKYCDNFLMPSKSGSEGWASDNKDINWIANYRQKSNPHFTNNKENDKAVPQDYEFKYAIIDKNGQNAKNHFLVFPERYYDEDGNIKWRIKLVVRDWNLRATVDDNYRTYLLDYGTEYQSNQDVECHFRLSKYTQICYRAKADIESISAKEYSGTNEGNKDDNKNKCAFVLCDDVFDESKPKYAIQGTIVLSNSENSSQGTEEFYISIKFYPQKAVYYKKKISIDSVDKKTQTRCPYCGRIMTSQAKYENDNSYCYSENINDARTCQYNFIGSVYGDGSERNRDSADMLHPYRDIIKKGYGNFAHIDEEGNKSQYKKFIDTLKKTNVTLGPIAVTYTH
ncbi:MAG: hypothetical protein K2M17_05035, partial [Bacilli bacterium]|nr:hypothetical protein [Bacilli bacterium]